MTNDKIMFKVRSMTLRTYWSTPGFGVQMKIRKERLPKLCQKDILSRNSQQRGTRLCQCQLPNPRNMCT